MKLSDFDYNLPEELIATHHANPRDHSRFLVLNKKTGEIEHKYFYDIIDYLNSGDVLVLNNSKVIPARLNGKKKETGGRVEVFLHKKINKNTWQCILGGKVKVGVDILFNDKFDCSTIKDNCDGTWEVVFNKEGDDLMKAVERAGQMPLPPYIIKQRRASGEDVVSTEDEKEYQTVFADDNKKGSVAAPTAGLHFTPELLEKIKEKGIKIEYITLYVGMGTFAPVKTDEVLEHKMHAEWVEIEGGVVDRLKNVKKNGGRVIAVGTTSARSLEACFQDSPASGRDFKKWVNIFIYPGYKFKIVDALITNFHLPKSTLLMLVSALASKKNIDKSYQEAIDKEYRFYSYGDAMFIK